MSNEPRRQSAHWVWLLVVAMPVFYVLGIGPAAYLSGTSDAVGAVIEIIYLPLEWLADIYPPFGDILMRYIMLFRQLPE